MTDFEKAVSLVLKFEAYWSDLPGDPGGLTIWGISSAAHPDVVARMKNVSKEEARKIAAEEYRKGYWIPAGCDKMDWPLNLVVFDSAVNCGLLRANRFMAGADWQQHLCNRAHWLIYESKSRYLNGLLNRVLAVLEAARS